MMNRDALIHAQPTSLCHHPNHASRFTYYALLLASCLLLLASCTSSPPLPCPSAPPPLPPATITGPFLHQDLPPDPDPTVEHPIIHLTLTITDRYTHQPVSADVTIDDATERAVTGLQVAIAANHPHTITVTAPGYTIWSYTLDTHLHHHKRLDLPVQLEPENDQA